MPRVQLSRGFSRGNRGRRRSVSWFVGPGDTGTTSHTSSASQIMGLGAQLTADGFTLIRIRGYFQIFLTSATAVLDGFSGALGIGIVTAEAFAIGITAMPDPVADADWDGWLFHHFFDVRSARATFDAGDLSAAQRLVVDSKAMRVLREGDTVFMAIETTEGGTAAGTSVFDSRMLLKHPA